MTASLPAQRRSGGLPIHVLVVDDHAAVRYGIRQMLHTQDDLITIAETGSACEATSELARWSDVAVIDYHLREHDGLWLTEQIKQRPRPPRVLIYSAFADAMLVVAAIVAGADGVLSKTALGEELCVAVRRLFGGRQYFPAPPQSVVAALRARLERRDQAVLTMLIHGLSAADIGSRLGMTTDELDARRRVMVRAIAPKASRAHLVGRSAAPLDYDRVRRRHRYRAAG
jgi:DNA-binding NarL/FixJ family response regulator